MSQHSERSVDAMYLELEKIAYFKTAIKGKKFLKGKARAARHALRRMPRDIKDELSFLKSQYDQGGTKAVAESLPLSLPGPRGSHRMAIKRMPDDFRRELADLIRPGD